MSAVQFVCPGCGNSDLSECYRIPRQPVVLNYRFPTTAAALQVRRRDVVLVQCANCGLIFNRAFDSSLIPYDRRYENRQCYSAAFQDHMVRLADELISRHELRGGRILEVGCGKGDFLTLLCERAGARGVGYDTSYEGPRTRLRGRVRFFDRYVAARDVTGGFDAVICRHVVEHIGAIGSFLRELHDITEACGVATAVIETPSFEWTAEHECFWDVFYEHCNYFTRPSLAYLCRLAGFSLVGQRALFGGQYQLIELRVGQPGKSGRAPRFPVRLTEFQRSAEAGLSALEGRLERHGAKRGWAIWGAGAKGVALVNRLRRLPPRFVVDSNPAKQGCVIPASRVPIVAPDDPRVRVLEVVLIANPNYVPEITATLRANDYSGEILAA